MRPRIFQYGFFMINQVLDVEQSPSPLFLTAGEAADHVGATPVVAITSKNPDYYVWGRNCQVLRLEHDDVKRIFSQHCDYLGSVTRDQRDLFWHGYVNAPVVR
jgi:hypothetical protein